MKRKLVEVYIRGRQQAAGRNRAIGLVGDGAGQIEIVGREKRHQHLRRQTVTREINCTFGAYLPGPPGGVVGSGNMPECRPLRIGRRAGERQIETEHTFIQVDATGRYDRREALWSGFGNRQPRQRHRESRARLPHLHRAGERSLAPWRRQRNCHSRGRYLRQQQIATAFARQQRVESPE